jgi:ADP-ribosyl-[dinitrogen reductase] hydrolase
LHDPDLDKHDLLSAFSRWQLGGEHSSTGQCFDIGDNTARALRDFRDNGTLIADCHGSSAGNGSIMRLAPVAIRWWKHIEKATDVAVEQCITTHTDPEAIACCELLVKAMCKLIAGGKQDCIIMPNPAWPERVRFIAEGNSIAMKENEISSSGYVIDTLEAAYWAFSNADSFEEAVLMAANLAEDSDTVAAVTGQLAGSYWGLKGIPEQWVDVIHGKKEIEGIAKALYRSQK